jgi:hypothetical protein
MRTPKGWSLPQFRACELLASETVTRAADRVFELAGQRLAQK